MRAARRDRYARQGHGRADDRRGAGHRLAGEHFAEILGRAHGPALQQGAIRPRRCRRTSARTTGFFALSSGSRSFLRYGYGDLLAEDRRYGVLHRIWPGTQRLLLWGDPVAADYGRVASFCGSEGVEFFEPLSFKGRKGSGLPGGRDAYADASLKPARATSKNTPTATGSGAGTFTTRTPCRKPGGAISPAIWPGGEAGGSGPGIGQPHPAAGHDRALPSAANNNYWPEMYTNMAIVAERTATLQRYAEPETLRYGQPAGPGIFFGH